MPLVSPNLLKDPADARAMIDGQRFFLRAFQTWPLSEVGIDAVFSILKRPCSLEDAIQDTDVLLADAAEQTVRLMLAARL